MKLGNWVVLVVSALSLLVLASFENLRPALLRGLWIPVAALGGLMLANSSALEKNGDGPAPRTPQQISSRWFFPLVGAYLLLLSISIALLLHSELRPTLYFVVASILVVVVFLQILSISRNARIPTFIVLVETATSVFALVYGKISHYAYYYGVMDFIKHDSFVASVIERGHIGGDLGTYSHFPVLHILSATVSLLADIDSATAIRLGIALVSSIVPVIVFCISKNLGQSSKVSAIIALFASVGSIYIFFSNETMPQTVAFILFLFAMLSISKRVSTPSFGFVSLVFSVAIVLTHQVLILFVIALLIILVFGKVILGHPRRTIRSNLVTIAEFAVVYVAYSAIMALAIYGIVFTKVESAVNTTTLPEPLNGINLLTGYARSLGSAILLFLYVFGVVWACRTVRRRVSNLQLSAMFSVAVLFGGLYFPNPLSFSSLLSDVFNIWRLANFVEPFVITSCAVAFCLLLLRRKDLRGLMLSISVVFIISFYSYGNMMAASDNPPLGRSSPQARLFFSQEDLATIDFLRTGENRSLQIESDYPSQLLIERYAGTVVPMTTPNGSLSIVGDALFFVRMNDFQTTGLLFSGYPTPGIPFTGAYLLRLERDDISSNTEVQWVLDSGDDVILSVDTSITMQTVVLGQS